VPEKLGPGRQIDSEDNPKTASADSEVRPGPRLLTLRARHIKIREAGPEALSTLSLPTRRFGETYRCCSRERAHHPVRCGVFGCRLVSPALLDRTEMDRRKSVTVSCARQMGCFRARSVICGGERRRPAGCREIVTNRGNPP
jgi:hypothetical protein